MASVVPLGLVSTFLHFQTVRNCISIKHCSSGYMVSYTEMDFFRNEGELAMINILTQKKDLAFQANNLPKIGVKC